MCFGTYIYLYMYMYICSDVRSILEVVRVDVLCTCAVCMDIILYTQTMIVLLPELKFIAGTS